MFALSSFIPLSAQRLSGNEYVAGAGLNIVLRGPWIDSNWRKPVPRFLLSQGISFGYEILLDSQTWNAQGHKPWKDIGQRVVGYVLTEAVVEVMQKIKGE